MKTVRLLAVAATMALMSPPRATAVADYEIEAASNDETFIINGEVFKAQSYCIGWGKGDRVIFLEGDPFGTCSSAKLYNRRMKETCDVWCE